MGTTTNTTSTVVKTGTSGTATTSTINVTSGALTVTVGAGGTSGSAGGASSVTNGQTTVRASGGTSPKASATTTNQKVTGSGQVLSSSVPTNSKNGTSSTAVAATAGSSGQVVVSWDAVTIPGSPAVVEPVVQPIYSPVYETVYTPIYTSVPGASAGSGAGGGYIKKIIEVVEGDVITVSVGAPGQSYVGGQGYVLSTSGGGTKPLIELVMSSENWVAPFNTSAGTENDICISVIDECSVSQSQINSDWNTFRSRWPTRKFYLLVPNDNANQVGLPPGFSTDPNAFGPILVNRDNGNANLASDWFTIANCDSLPNGAQIRLAVDRSGSLGGSDSSRVRASIDLMRTKASFDSGINYSGGNAGTGSARGGGGGAATVVLLNGVIIAVAGGGGGGGAGGTGTNTGTSGSPATTSGQGRGAQGQGGASSTGSATGGGGGGGHYGGAAGTSGTRGLGGSGGVNFGGLVSLAGSGSTPGGATVPEYPGGSIGYAGNSGGAVLSFYKSFNVSYKVSNTWRDIDKAWIKFPGGRFGEWKEIYNGWVKVNNEWRPLITSNRITGTETVYNPVSTYTLTGSTSIINEGDTVVFTLRTTGVPIQTSVPYTVTGIESTDLASGSSPLTGNFIVGTNETATFIARADSLTESTKTLRISLNNNQAFATCLINDTSTTPIPGYTLTASTPSLNEGGSVTFTLSTVNVANGTQIGYYITGIDQSDLDSGEYRGNFVVGSSMSKTFTLKSDLTTEGAETIRCNLNGLGINAYALVNDTSITRPSGSRTFTTPGPGFWTVPDRVTSVRVTAYGGGGGAGGSHSNCENPNSHRGGTGGAGYVTAKIISVTPGSSIAYTVGAGGAGGRAQTNGADGQASSFSSVSGAGGPGGDGNTKHAPIDTAGGSAGNGGQPVIKSGATGGNGGAGRIFIEWGPNIG